MVVVTTWAYSNGEGSTPAAIKPAGCAISANKYAPISSQICLNFL